MNNFFEKLIHFGFLYEDLIAPIATLTIAACLLVAAIIHWRFK